MNNLLKFLMENPGMADVMDTQRGEIVHTGGYSAHFGFIPVTSVDTNEVVGCYTVGQGEESNVARLLDSTYETLVNELENFKSIYSKKDKLEWVDCSQDVEDISIYKGTVKLNGYTYSFTVSSKEMSGLVNNKTPQQLVRCLDSSTINAILNGHEYDCSESLRCKLLLLMCASF